MSKSQRQRDAPLADRTLLFVVMRFALYFAALVVAIFLANAVGVWRNMQLATASLSTAIAGTLGLATTRSGILIGLTGRTLSIDLACTALFIVALYSALVLAYPVSPKMRLFGMAAGTPIILLANIGRIVAAIAVSAALPSEFQFFHDYLFEAGMVLVTVAIWAVWLSSARRDAR